MPTKRTENITKAQLEAYADRLVKDSRVSTRREADIIWAMRCCATHAFQAVADGRLAEEMAAVWGLMTAGDRR